MKILAFDTTGEVNSVAILDAGRGMDLLKIEGESKGAELLVPAIDEIMKKNNLEFTDLDAIATSKGPASFTSVRIGLSAAKGLVLACDKKLLTYDSLLAQAYGYRDFIGRITVVIDAKMNEFFVASFISDGEKIVIDQESRLESQEGLLSTIVKNNQLIVGSGAEILSQVAFDKGVAVKIGNESKGDILAGNLALMAFEDLSNGVDINGDSKPNYARQPKIGKRKT